MISVVPVREVLLGNDVKRKWISVPPNPVIMASVSTGSLTTSVSVRKDGPDPTVTLISMNVLGTLVRMTESVSMRLVTTNVSVSRNLQERNVNIELMTVSVNLVNMAELVRISIMDLNVLVVLDLLVSLQLSYRAYNKTFNFFLEKLDV